MIETDAAALLTSLADALGPDRVLTDPDQRERAGMDMLRGGRAALGSAPELRLPLAVVMPERTDEVCAVLRVAAAHGTPVLVHGGGTGLMGGGRTVRPGIVIDQRRMNRVLAVSPGDRTVTVQAGIVIADLNAALAEHGLFCGHDPWTVPIATVGGTYSTNGLGYLSGAYGSISEQALGLEVVLADGTVVRTRSVERSATGPPLRWLFAGAEGTLGVITEMTLRVFPLPEARELVALDFPGFAEGHAAACAMAAIGLRPALLDFGGPPSSRRGASRMILGFEGFREGVAAARERALAICRAEGAVEQDAREAWEFWDSRHVPAERVRGWRTREQGEPQPGEPGAVLFEYLHCALPATRAIPFLTQASDLLEGAGATVGEWGLWRGPELVSLSSRAAAESPEALAHLRGVYDRVLMLAQDMGGSMEYVHGVGLRLRHLLAREMGSELNLLGQIKRLVDPDGLLNPGKLA